MGKGVLPETLRGVLEESPRAFFGSGKRAIGADYVSRNTWAALFRWVRKPGLVYQLPADGWRRRLNV